MAGQQQNIICYQIREEREEIKGQEIRKNRHYTRVLHSTLHLDEKTGILSQGETALDEVSIDCWSGGNKREGKNKTVSTLIGTPAEQALHYNTQSIPAQPCRGNDSTEQILNPDRENTSFQFSRTDLWSTTFQDSGWLDIFANSSTTELFK